LDETLSREDPESDLWFRDPDACCRIRKVEPLARALKPSMAGSTTQAISGRPPSGDPGRSSRMAPGSNSIRSPVSPANNRDHLPERQFASASFSRIRISVGRVYALHQPNRDGRRFARWRWRGRDKTECGIHTIKAS